jgi:hypothetical protein
MPEFVNSVQELLGYAGPKHLESRVLPLQWAVRLKTAEGRDGVAEAESE